MNEKVCTKRKLSKRNISNTRKMYKTQNTLVEPHKKNEKHFLITLIVRNFLCIGLLG